MNKMERSEYYPEKSPDNIWGFLFRNGYKYQTAAVLPVLAGTLLPFWLRPSGFSFNRITAAEFLIAALLFHNGFILLLDSVRSENISVGFQKRLRLYAAGFILTACFFGLHINNNLTFRSGVPDYIFVVYGVCSLVAGILYVFPPFNFHKRVGGEVIIAEGLGMVPMLGAYLIQAGDLIRLVYLASLPLVVATGLWIWIDELAGREMDEKSGRRTMVLEFGPRFSGRVGVTVISLILLFSIISAVFTKAVNPAALISLVSAGILFKLVMVSWKDYSSPLSMEKMRKYAYIQYIITGAAFAFSSLI